MSLVSRLVQGTTFSQFTDFVSPTFFQVMPARQMFMQGRALVSSYRDASAFADAMGLRREALAKTTLPITIGAPVVDGKLAAAADKKAMGELVVALYFHQLFTPQPTLLDLSARRFSQRNGQLVWSPGAGHVHWDETFRAAMCNVYRVFYSGGDLAAALAPLGLSSAADLFAKHFGGGDQSAVTFSVDAFVKSFHEIFVHCREHGIALHPNFLPLGLYLATMYDTLEKLGVALDVRSAFAKGSQ